MVGMVKMVVLVCAVLAGCGGAVAEAGDAGTDAVACSATPARWEPYCSEPARPFTLTDCPDADVVHVDGKTCRAQANVLSEWYCCLASD
jgi:hypothetical protein